MISQKNILFKFKTSLCWYGYFLRSHDFICFVHGGDPGSRFFNKEITSLLNPDFRFRIIILDNKLVG